MVLVYPVAMLLVGEADIRTNEDLHAPRHNGAFLSRQHSAPRIVSLLTRSRLGQATDQAPRAAVGLGTPPPPSYPPPWYAQPSPTYSPCKFSVCVPGITHPYPGKAPEPQPPPQFKPPS